MRTSFSSYIETLILMQTSANYYIYRMFFQLNIFIPSLIQGKFKALRLFRQAG